MVSAQQLGHWCFCKIGEHAGVRKLVPNWQTNKKRHVFFLNKSVTKNYKKIFSIKLGHFFLVLPRCHVISFCRNNVSDFFLNIKNKYFLLNYDVVTLLSCPGVFLSGYVWISSFFGLKFVMLQKGDSRSKHQGILDPTQKKTFLWKT